MNWADQNYSIGRGLAALRHKRGIEYQPYLRALLETLLPDLLGSATGSTFPNVSRDQLAKAKIFLHSPDQQLAISRILNSLDNKIELNRQMCKTLEDLTSTLFKSWFIDFDPVKAKAAGRNPEGLSPEIADLFPNRFVGSTHEILPLGWQLQPLEELTNISIGRTPPRKEAEWFSLSSTDNKWISIKDLGDATVFISKTSEFLTSAAVKKFRIPIIPPKTVVISFKLTVGRVAITSEEMLSNEAIAHCSNPKIPVEFLYLFLKKYNFDLLGNTSSIGTAVNSKSIKSIKILVPGIELINYIKPYFQDVFDKIHHIVKENYKLLEIRNLLIPKLISGSVKLKDIQDICKDV